MHVGKAQLAFGLQWSTLPGVGKQAHEVSKLVKDNHAQFVTVFKRNESSKAMVGLLGNSKDKSGKDKSNKDKNSKDGNNEVENNAAENIRDKKRIQSVKGKTLSAAVLFARAVPTPNAMFIYRFPDDLCVFIGILDGVPMPGYDSCGSAKHVQQLLTQFMRLRQGRQGVALKLYGNMTFDGVEAPSNLSLQELLVASRKTLQEAVLTPTRFPVSTIVVAVVLLASLFAAYAGYGVWKKQSRKPSSITQQETDPNRWYQESLPRTLADAGYSARKVAPHLLDTINGMELFHAGWSLSSMKCKPGSCDVTWKIIPGGSFQSFKEALPSLSHSSTPSNLQNVQYQKDLKTISATLAFDLPKEMKGLKVETLPKQAEFEFNQDDRNQRMTGLYPLITRKPTQNVLAIPTSMDESRLNNAINVGEWEARGFFHQADMLQVLPENMTLESLEVSFAPGAFTLFCQGKYYVKK